MRRHRRHLLSLATALLLILAGCGMNSMQHAGATTKADQSFDIQFIDMMVPHHQGAVAMAEIARVRAEHREIKDMAEAIVAAQEQEIGQMRAWRKEWFGSDRTPSMDLEPMLHGPSPPQSGGHDGHGSTAASQPMTMDMAAEVEALRNAPDPFDHAFIDAMIPHHRSAIEAVRAAETRAERPEIKQLAGAIISDQQREIAQMERWRDAWYGPHAH